MASMDAMTRSQEEMREEMRHSQEETKSLLEASLRRVENLEKKVVAMADNQAATSKHLASHDSDISYLKVISNATDQQQRANNIRILGFPVLSEELSAAGDGGSRLRDLIHNRLLKPLFEDAVRERFILSPPAAQEAILKIFRAGRLNQGAQSAPPPIIVVLASPLLRAAVFRFKGKALPQPNTVEKEAGARRFYLVEDLTRPSHRLFKALQASEAVAKVWTTDGQIKFIKTGDDSIHRVTNVFEPLDKILE